MSSQDRKPLPPYLPFRSFESYLDSLKAFGATLPNVIDRASMKQMSGGMQSWVLSALRYLALIDRHGVPTNRLRQLVSASPEGRKAMYREIVEKDYAFLNGINLQGATPKQMIEAFESIGATGDTVRKAMGFFIGLAKAAGVPLSPLISKASRRPKAPNGGTSRPRKAAEVETSRPPDASVSAPTHSHSGARKTTFDVIFGLLNEDMAEEERNAVWVLLQYAKRKGDV